MKNVSATVLHAVDTASQTSAQIDSSQTYGASFQAIFGDTSAAGTLKIQMSNDLNPNGPESGFTVTNWSDIPLATSTVASGACPPIILSFISARYLRVVYTRSGGGTTTMTVNMFATCV